MLFTEIPFLYQKIVKNRTTHFLNSSHILNIFDNSNIFLCRSSQKVVLGKKIYLSKLLAALLISFRSQLLRLFKCKIVNRLM